MKDKMLEKRLSIHDSSQELLQEVIKTLPLESKGFEIIMLSKGIQYPMTLREQEKRDKYLSECAKNNTLPFTALNFRYDEKMNLFTPGLININFPIKGKNDIQSILRGGKIYEIQVGSSKFVAQQAFENFRIQFLNEPPRPKGRGI